MKAQLNQANDKVISMEEELFESKTIQNELLTELKEVEDRLQTALDENEGIHDQYRQQMKDLQYQRDHAMNQIYHCRKNDIIDETLGNFLN